MAKVAQRPTHLTVVFTHDTYMRREHVSGAPQQQEGESLMFICKMGEEKRVLFNEAQYLMVQETAIEANKLNEDAIADIRQLAKEIEARNARMSKEAPRAETLEQTITRVLAGILGKAGKLATA
jgi:hypothetical protein